MSDWYINLFVFLSCKLHFFLFLYVIISSYSRLSFSSAARCCVPPPLRQAEALLDKYPNKQTNKQTNCWITASISSNCFQWFLILFEQLSFFLFFCVGFACPPVSACFWWSVFAVQTPHLDSSLLPFRPIWRSHSQTCTFPEKAKRSFRFLFLEMHLNKKASTAKKREIIKYFSRWSFCTTLLLPTLDKLFEWRNVPSSH